jgi:hypothetical protein
VRRVVGAVSMDAAWKIAPDVWARVRRDRRPTCGPHATAFFEFKINPTSAFSRMKNPGKFVVLQNSIWNTFHYCNFFQIFTDFELFQRF